MLGHRNLLLLASFTLTATTAASHPTGVGSRVGPGGPGVERGAECTPQGTAYSGRAPGESAPVQGGDGELKACFDELRADLRAGRERFRSDESESLGSYLVVVVGVSPSAEEPLVRGRLMALRRMGSFLGVEVSSETKLEKRSETTGVGAEKKTNFFKSLSTSTTTKVQQFLAGVDMIDLVESPDVIHLGYALTERQVGRVEDLQAAFAGRQGAGGETIVRALGVARGEEGRLQEEQLRELAISDGLRTAVRKTAGGMILAQNSKVGRDFLEERIYSATYGTYSSYELLEGGLSGATYTVTLSVTIDPGKVIEDFRSHLSVLGSPKFHLDERSQGVGGSRFAPALQHKLSGFGFPFTTDPAAADFLFWLDSNWSRVTQPYPPRKAGLQLQANLYWVDPDGAQHSILSSDGDVSDFTGGGQAAGRCVEKFLHREEADMKQGLQEKLEEFQANGRQVFVAIEGASFEELEPVAEALRKDPFIKGCERKQEDGDHPALACRTFLRADDLAGLLRRVAGGLEPGQGLDLAVKHVQSTRIQLEVLRPQPGS